jgi:hypothetical protein
VKREVGQLMTKCARKVVLIGAKQDDALAGLGDGGAPGRGSAGGERIERAAVGDDDEAERTGITEPESRPLGGTVGGAGQLEGNRLLSRPRDDRDPTDLDRGRVALEQENER